MKVSAPRVRAAGRLALSATLRRIPGGIFEPLRRAYPSAAKGSVADRLMGLALGVIRYRGLPKAVSRFALTDNPEVSIANRDSYIVERLYWFGEKKGYEPEVVYWWRKWCAVSTKILEVGANIGYLTVQGALANRTAQYVAVEPHPGAAACCRENLRINEIDSVKLVEAAAVGSTGPDATVTLFLPGGRDHYKEAPCTGFAAGNELRDEAEGFEEYDSVDVAAVALSTLMAGVDLLKIDAEGLEHQLLESVQDLIRSERPTIFLELLDGTPMLRRFISQLCESTAYRCFILQDSKLLPVEPAELTTLSLGHYRTRDLVLTCGSLPHEAG